MTQIAIQKQIDAIIQATREATKSKESATQFLIDAGIIKKPIHHIKRFKEVKAKQ